MNLADLRARLDGVDDAARLVFHVEDQPIGEGYHVTELRHSQSTGIDCGGNVERVEDARLQLLDGAGEAHMAVGKFRGILSQSMARLPELTDAPLLVEFAPGNKGLRVMRLGEFATRGDQILIELKDTSAVCKPAQKRKSDTGATGQGADCCGGERVSGTACCA